MKTMIDHWNLKTFAQAESEAARLTKETGALHIAADRGRSTYPRFKVIAAPIVGDAVSYSFNGDSYPCGKITHVTKGTLRVIKTDTGDVFYRRGLTDIWKRKGGTWCLIMGHVSERNPHF